MKKLIHTLVIRVVLGALAIMASSVFAQSPDETTTTTTVTTSKGIVSEFTPNVIAVKVDPTAVPVRYTFTKTTTYVDENGNPVSVETVRSGLPVTVYYDRSGDNLVATKVVVRKSVSTTDPSVPMTQEESATPPSANGIVSDADSDEISIKTDMSSRPSHYKAKDATAYVDEKGNPVARNTVRTGTPVTIFFERDGESLVATRVVVRSSVSIQPTTQTVEEKQTTTTTGQ